MPKDALTRRRDRRPAGFCQEETPVLTEQFSSVECDAFHVSYLSDKIPEAVFHGQAVKTVAYLTVSTPAAGRAQPAPRQRNLSRFPPICSMSPADFNTQSKLMAGMLE